MSLLDLYQEATPVQKIRGKYWYNHARLFCLMKSLEYNVSQEKIAAVLSVLSPRVKWEQNLKDVELVIWSFQESIPYQEVPARAYKANVAKAYRILEGQRPEFGQKTYSFYNCIVFPDTQDVCIDIWAARALGYSKSKISKKDYKAMQAQYREAAQEIGIEPYKLQAIIWVKIRHDNSSKK